MSYRGSGGFSLGGSLSTMVRLLIAWNVIFFLGMTIAEKLNPVFFELALGYLGLVPAALFHGYVWQLVSYMFLHGSFMHILFNMLALWMFGSELEYEWGAKRFLQYYFVTGIGAGITNAVFQPHSTVPIVGASGAIYGLLLAFALHWPNRPILIWFLFPMPAKYFVILFGAIEFVSSLPSIVDQGRGHGSGIAHLAHLGGILFGLIFLWIVPWGPLRRRRRKKPAVYDIRDYIDRDDR
jgi:membrane associated rhomboid family serine protease